MSQLRALRRAGRARRRVALLRRPPRGRGRRARASPSSSAATAARSAASASTELRGSLHHYGPATPGWIFTAGQMLSGAREEAAVPGHGPHRALRRPRRRAPLRGQRRRRDPRPPADRHPRRRPARSPPRFVVMVAPRGSPRSRWRTLRGSPTPRQRLPRASTWGRLTDRPIRATVPRMTLAARLGLFPLRPRARRLRRRAAALRLPHGGRRARPDEGHLRVRQRRAGRGQDRPLLAQGARPRRPDPHRR